MLKQVSRAPRDAKKSFTCKLSSTNTDSAAKKQPNTTSWSTQSQTGNASPKEALSVPQPQRKVPRCPSVLFWKREKSNTKRGTNSASREPAKTRPHRQETNPWHDIQQQPASRQATLPARADMNSEGTGLAREERACPQRTFVGDTECCTGFMVLVGNSKNKHKSLGSCDSRLPPRGGARQHS